MTVAELIAVLYDQNPEAEVIVEGFNTCAPVRSIRRCHAIRDGGLGGNMWYTSRPGTMGSVPSVAIVYDDDGETAA